MSRLEKNVSRQLRTVRRGQMKYDCNNIMDYGHEFRRLCDSYLSCSDNGRCPLIGRYCNSLGRITQEEIDILQKWSDENPEAPMLTKRDRMFLESFAGTINRRISRDDCRAFYEHNGVSNMLSFDMFKALEPNTTMTFEELLALEVED